MPIIPDNPIVVPAKTYNRMWIEFLSVDSPKISGPEAIPNPDASAVFRLRPYDCANLESAQDSITVKVDSLFQRIAAGDQKLAQILSLILEYAAQEAKTQGLI